MARIARVVAPGPGHHVTQRGNRRQQVSSARTAGWMCTWGQYLADEDDGQIGPLLRRHENTGQPLGDRAFVQRVGTILGRNLVPGKPGQPKKDNK